MSGFYSEDHRSLQDRFDSRALADTLAAITVQPHLDEDAIAFIGLRSFFFLSTVDAQGHPTVSHKGGAPGFVRVLDPTTLAFPSYDGNGMFLSMGNIAGDGRIGLLFMDFETPHRVRVQANATVSAEDPLMAEYPGADLLVRATVVDSFINCPRYITPRGSDEPSVNVPDERGDAPLADWQRLDLLQDVLPERHQGRAVAEGGTLDLDEYAERVRRDDD